MDVQEAIRTHGVTNLLVAYCNEKPVKLVNLAEPVISKINDDLKQDLCELFVRDPLNSNIFNLLTPKGS